MKIVPHYQKKYPPIGRCIYCGSTDEPLGAEHIVPFSLAGTSTLPKASCRDCEAAISYVEGYMARHVFHLLRPNINIQPRKRKGPPATFAARFRSDLGWQQRAVEMKHAPAVVHLPQYPKYPGLMRLAPPSPLTCTGHHLWASTDFNAKMFELMRPEETEWQIDMKVNDEVFGRFLAKVAHTHAVAFHGLDSFNPFLSDIILGKDKNVGHYVGGDGKMYPPRQLSSTPQHVEGMHIVEVGSGFYEGMNLLVAIIRLFTIVGGPGYMVVIGNPGDALLAEQGGGIRPLFL
jgi:hypothetical protein